MNILSEIINNKESEGFRFRPTRDFYKVIGIKQKRFGMLLRNEMSPTLDELKAISKYFNVPITTFIN